MMISKLIIAAFLFVEVPPLKKLNKDFKIYLYYKERYQKRKEKSLDFF